MLKIRGGSSTYVKPDGTIGTAGKGALFDSELAYTVSATQDQTLIDGTQGKYIVRRLTPLECERLQGFPDGWTDVPYKGKDHPADAPRYKSLGNSMTVSVIAWLGERIKMVNEIMEKEGAAHGRINH